MAALINDPQFGKTTNFYCSTEFLVRNSEAGRMSGSGPGSLVMFHNKHWPRAGLGRAAAMR